MEARQHPASAPRLFSREALLCAALFCVCIALTWPVAEVGINDDWVYTLIAQDLARTGHLHFHGWASPMLGWQALWGALFAKVLGSTFTAIRLSTVPVAIASTLLYHAILRRFGLNRAHATLGTLAVVLGPVFLALSATFMTDIPSLFAILVCVYLCQRALATPDARAASLWLVAAGLSNIALGTVRQIAWLGVLVIVPCCGWLLRHRRYVLHLTAAIWLFGILCIGGSMHWFARQPYTSPVPIIPGTFTPAVLGGLTLWMVRAALDLALLMLPLLTVAPAAIWPPSRRQAVRIGGGFLLFVALIAVLHAVGRTHFVEPPWLGNTLGTTGIMQGGVLFGSTRAVPQSLRLLVCALVVVVVLCFAEAMVSRRSLPVTEDTGGSAPDSRAAAILLLPFLAAYGLLLLPLVAFFAMFDRYLIEIIAVLSVFLLRWHQRRISPRVPAFAFGAIAVFAIVGVAATHDMFAMDRAEVRAAAQLQQAGVPRTEIEGGFAFDSTTQVYAWGYLNDSRIRNPAGAYRPQPLLPPAFRDGVYCGYPFQRYVPALHIRYVIAADPSPCLGPTSFAPQNYRTWLPPADRQLQVGILLPADKNTP